MGSGSGLWARARMLELKFYIGTEFKNELKGIMTKASICLKATIKPDVELKGSAELRHVLLHCVTKARARYLVRNETQSPKIEARSSSTF